MDTIHAVIFTVLLVAVVGGAFLYSASAQNTGALGIAGGRTQSGYFEDKTPYKIGEKIGTGRICFYRYRVENGQNIADKYCNTDRSKADALREQFMIDGFEVSEMRGAPKYEY